MADWAVAQRTSAASVKAASLILLAVFSSGPVANT